MNLNIITAQDVQRNQANAAGPISKDDAFSKLLKYIPSITVGTFLAIQGVVAEISNKDTRSIILWLVLVLLAIGTYIYRQRRGVVRKLQLWLTVGAFLVWVFAIGGPFAETGWWHAYMGSIALFLATFFLAVYDPPPLPDD